MKTRISPSLKICFVSEFSVVQYKGGGEQRYYEIGKQLIRRGHEVYWLCLRTQKLAGPSIREGIHIIPCGPRIDKPPMKYPLQTLGFMAVAFLHLITHSYDIVDAQTYFPLIPSYLARTIKGKKTLATIHDISSKKQEDWVISPKKYKMYHFFEGLFYKIPYSCIILVSNPIRHRLMHEYNVPSHKISVVHNGVDINLIDSIKSGKRKRRIIYVGRLIPHKHVDDLIEAFEVLTKKNLPLELVIIGSGIEESHLKEQAKHLPVTFLGTLDNYTEVIRHIKESSCLVLPSTREGFGMVLAEAMACHTPCVAYRSDGAVDVIDHKKTGLLVEKRDTAGLASAIEYALKHSAQLTANARAAVERRFTWEKTAAELEKVYALLGD